MLSPTLSMPSLRQTLFYSKFNFLWFLTHVRSRAAIFSLAPFPWHKVLHVHPLSQVTEPLLWRLSSGAPCTHTLPSSATYLMMDNWLSPIYWTISQLLLQLLGAQTALCIPISIPVEMQAQVGLLDCTGKSVLVPALHRGSMKSYSHCSASVLFSLYPYQNQHQLPSTLPVVLKGALSRSNLPGKRRRIFLCKQ